MHFTAYVSDVDDDAWVLHGPNAIPDKQLRSKAHASSQDDNNDIVDLDADKDEAEVRAAIKKGVADRCVPRQA